MTRHSSSIVALIAAGTIALSTDAVHARGRSVPDAGDVPRTVQQLEQMRSPVRGERLFYGLHEVALQAGVADGVILASIRGGSLCAIAVDGVRLVPAGAARAYVERTAVAASVNRRQAPRRREIRGAATATDGG